MSLRHRPDGAEPYQLAPEPVMIVPGKIFSPLEGLFGIFHIIPPGLPAGGRVELLLTPRLWNSSSHPDFG